MTKDEFAKEFLAEVDAAARDVESRLGGRAARPFQVAYGEPGRRPLIDLGRTTERLVKDAPLFPRIVDISVIALRDDATVLFVRPSDHPPAPWEQAWNVPEGRGPFKILAAKEIDDRRAV